VVRRPSLAALGGHRAGLSLTSLRPRRGVPSRGAISPPGPCRRSRRGSRGSVQINRAGVFASRHHLRPRILPPSVVPASGQQFALGLDEDDDDSPAAAEASARPRRIGWARLLARVFAIDVTVCRKCGGRMRVLDVVTDQGDIAASSTAPALLPVPGLILPASSGCSSSDRASARAQGARLVVPSSGAMPSQGRFVRGEFAVCDALRLPAFAEPRPVRTPSPLGVVAGYSSYRLGRENSRLKPL